MDVLSPCCQALADFLKPGARDPVSRGRVGGLCRRVEEEGGRAVAQVRPFIGILPLSRSPGSFTGQAARTLSDGAPPLPEVGGDSGGTFHCDDFLPDQWCWRVWATPTPLLPSTAGPSLSGSA